MFVSDLIVGRDTGLLHVAFYTLSNSCRVITIDPSGTYLGETPDLPSVVGCGVTTFTEDNVGNILVGGVTGQFWNAAEPVPPNPARAAVWRIPPGGLVFDASFGSEGRLTLPGSNAPMLVTRIVYDGAKRLAIFARKLNFVNNDNDIVVSRRYSSDGGVDASWNYTGEVNIISLSPLSEDILASSVDSLLRIVLAGGQNIVPNNVSR